MVAERDNTILGCGGGTNATANSERKALRQTLARGAVRRFPAIGKSSGVVRRPSLSTVSTQGAPEIERDHQGDGQRLKQND
jgi:hypothetical protein